MELLAGVGHIDDFVWMPGRESVLERGEIGSRIIRRAVALLDDSWVRFPFAFGLHEERILVWWRGTVGEDADGSFARAGQAGVEQFRHDAFQLCVIEAFAKRVVEA